MADSGGDGCGCLVLIALVLILMATGVLTINCGGVYLGPAPKEGKP